MDNALSSVDSEDYRSTPNDLVTLLPVNEYSAREPWPLSSASPTLSLSTTSDLTRPGNEWLLALRRTYAQSESDDLSEHRYRVTPIIFVGDIYRIRLYTWRLNKKQAYDDIHQRVLRESVNPRMDIYAVEIGADQVAPVTREHFSEDGGRGNFFLVGVPALFVLRVSVVSSVVPDILVSMNPLLAVSDLKAAIQQARGYPPNRIDLVHEGHVLENTERLYLYNLRNDNTIKMVLQRNIFVSVHFHTFWDRMYDLDVDVTFTVNDVVALVLRKCVTGRTGKYSINECFISPNALTIKTPDGQILSPLDCISRGLDTSRSDNYLTIVEDRSSDFYVSLSISDEIGEETYNVRAAEGSKLIPVYLRLHGITNIPIDLMTLVAPGRTLNPFDNLHTEYYGKKLAVITQDVQSVQLLHTQRFDVVMPAGSTVTVYVNKGGKISDIKKAVERMGYIHANGYSISHKEGILNDNRPLHRCDFKNYDNYVFLVRGEFTVDVVAVRGEMRRVRIQDHSNVEFLYEAGDNLYEEVRDNSQYVFCGDILPRRRTAHRAKLHPSNIVFQDRTSQDLVLEIIYGPEQTDQKAVKLSIHRHSVAFQLRRLLSGWNLTESTFEALEQAIIWRNFARSQTEILRSLVPTEVREDVYGVQDVSDAQYRWNFQDHTLGPKREVQDEIADRAQRVRELLGVNDRRTRNYIDLPPMQLHNEPLTLHYNRTEGLQSLIGSRTKLKKSN